ncbi:putative membrane protein [Burkholderiales bacterium JOSHI_001]|nr:putative membrane protein [Burkholderiales bacterium JOSHI_001]
MAPNFQPATLDHLSPAVLIHLVLAVGALVLGPLALRARKGSRLHRASGYTWVTLMLGAALSSVFIRDFRLPNLAGFTPIHILTVVTFVGVISALVAIARRNVQAHKKAMWRAYVGGCIGAGAFALMPGRYLGSLLWHHTLGLV